MACGACAKRRQPTGYGSGTAAARAPRPSVAPTPVPTPTPHIHVSPSGEQTTYGSRLEAQAARIRLGGEVRPA